MLIIILDWRPWGSWLRDFRGIGRESPGKAKLGFFEYTQGSLCANRFFVEKKDRILNLQLEQESLQGRQEDLKEIGVEMIRLTSDFNEIFNRLGTMQQIWTMVRRRILMLCLYIPLIRGIFPRLKIRSDAVGLQEAMSQLRNARTVAVSLVSWRIPFH